MRLQKRKIMNRNDIKVRVLGKEDVPGIVDVLCDSFADYPVMRFILGSELNYSRRLKILINFFVMARIYREEVVFGLGDSTKLSGVALTSNPNKEVKIAELIDLRNSVWQRLGPETLKRYQMFNDVWAQFNIDVPHIHLNMIGIKFEDQGKGYANKLMAQVNILSKSDPVSEGISLTTEDPAKVSFYQYLGYNLIGEARVYKEIKTWGFFKAN
jgi:hypothetical protein